MTRIVARVDLDLVECQDREGEGALLDEAPNQNPNNLGGQGGSEAVPEYLLNQGGEIVEKEQGSESGSGSQLRRRFFSGEAAAAKLANEKE